MPNRCKADGCRRAGPYDGYCWADHPDRKGWRLYSMETVERFRKLVASGIGQREAARRCGMNPDVGLSAILRGKTYKKAG
jgi:hypothetical protein